MRPTLDPLAPRQSRWRPSALATKRDAAEMPLLLAKLIAEQASTGLPPAYLPKDEREFAASTHADTAEPREGEPS